VPCPQLILLGRRAGSHQIPQRLVFLVRHPDRSQIPRPIAARQLHGVPPIRLHPIPGFDRNQTWGHHLALHPKGGRLPIENISRRTRLIAGLQLLGRPLLLHQFANRLFSIRNDPQQSNLSLGLGHRYRNRLGMDI